MKIMRYWRHGALASCFGLFAGSLSGCGGSENETTPAPTTPTPTPPREEGEELTFPEVKEVASPSVSIDLTMEEVKFGDFGWTTRGYDGGLPGPTFKFNPGETLKVKLINKLKPEDNFNCDQTGKNKCETEITNLHTHGLHVSSKSPGDNILDKVLPGAEKEFSFVIPEDHAPGMHWYHPHHHHSTAMQAGGGAAGVLIVKDPPGFLPQVYEDMDEKIMVISYLDFGDLQKYARESKGRMWANASDIATENGMPTEAYLVNGQKRATMSMKSGKWYRLRFVFASIKERWEMRLRGIDAGGADCSLRVLAKDGIYLKDMPRTVDHFHLYPAARSDVAMSCTCRTYPCKAASSPSDKPLEDILTFKIEKGETDKDGNVVDAPDLTEHEPDYPCYLADLQQAGVPDANKGELVVGRLDTEKREENGIDKDRLIRWKGHGASDYTGNQMTYAALKALPNKMEDWPAIGTFNVGEVYEMNVIGASNHPYHVHVNPYQIVSFSNGEASVNGIHVGDWHDTMFFDRLTRKDTVTVRMNTDRFTGKMTMHCHLLQHEDEGMMNWMDLAGSEGETFECAKSLNPKCYNERWTKQREEHPVDENCTKAAVLSPKVAAEKGVRSAAAAPDSRSVRTPQLAWLVFASVAAVLSLTGLGFVVFSRVGSQKAARDLEADVGPADDANDADDIELKAACA